MATISIDVGNNAARIANAFGKAYDYQAQIPDPNNPGQTIPNPQTLNAFTKQKIADFVKSTVMSVEAEDAATTARNTAIEAAKTQLVIT